MYPAYGGMSSYPSQSPQMPSPQYYPPSWEAAPPHVKEDPVAAGPSFMYGSWPQNYGYTFPMQCPSCCNHVQYRPTYPNFRPPCAHFPSPPPACGGPFCPPHPVGYVPPPHYTIELPRYEYDKNAPREFHCCACHNHSCHAKEDKHVKIEQHEPEVENRKSESLVPVGANNFTQPILWIPPGYTINKNRQQQQLPRLVVESQGDNQQVSPYYVKKPQSHRRPIETEVEEQQESPRVKKPQCQRRPVESEAGEYVEFPKTVEQEPNVRYGWFPLDMNSIKELLEGGQGKKDMNSIKGLLEGGQGKKACERESKGGDEKNIQAIENKEQNKQFPFPILWMPYGEQGENEFKGQQEKDAGTPGKKASPTFKIIPMRFANEPEKIKSTVEDDDRGNGSHATEKTGAIKTIPVKPYEEYVPKQLKKDEEQQKDSPKPVRNVEGNGSNGQSASPKKSKLPPICLRIDPPKKKNGNGRSRSPSPVKKQQESVESKTGGSKKEIKVVEAEDKGSSQSKIGVSCKAAEQRMEKLMADVEKKGVEGYQSQEAKEVKPQEAEKPARKILSEQEAATVIQSAYRGHDVRRWEPLKKLRQIAKVREEAAKIKRLIEDLESCAGSSTDEKEKATLAETIMKLLLKLDTIQGLPPSFRDVRRSVAKELIILQEKVDSIINKKSAPMAHEISTAEEPSSQEGGSKGIVETTEEPSNLFGQLEGSEVVEKVQETSNVSGLEENTKDVSETAEEFSKSSSELESSEVDDKSVKAYLDESSRDVDATAADSMIPSETEMSEEEDTSAKTCIGDEEEVPKLNEVCSAQPLSSQEVVSSSEDKTLETSPVKSEPQDEISSGSPVPTLADSQMDVKKEESVGSKILQEKPPAEVADQPAKTVTGENTTKLVGEPLGHKHVRASEAPEVDIAHAKIDESTQQTELPKESAEEGVEEQISEIQCSETLSRVLEDQSAHVKDEATLHIGPGSCKRESSDSISIGAQKVQEAEPTDVDHIPIVEHNVHGAEKSTAEECVDGVKLNSPIASGETRVSHDEEAREPGGTNQEKILLSVLDQQTVSGHGDLTDQPIRSEPEVAEIVTEESKDEQGAAKESKEAYDQEEKIDKRVIEENEKLREMLERLIAAEKQQQDLIASLSGKVKDLEKQLARKKKKKSSKRSRVLVSRASCGNGKPSNGPSPLRGRPMSVAS